jgi:hypothetical protein
MPFSGVSVCGDSSSVSECGAASVCNDAVDNGHSRSLLAQFGLTAEVQTRAGCEGGCGCSLGVIGGHERADGHVDMRRSHLKNFYPPTAGKGVKLLTR